MASVSCRELNTATTSPARPSISLLAGRCRRAGPAVKVAADRGWQNSGLRLQAGKRYRLTASGRYQVGKTTQRLVVRAGRRIDPLLPGPPAGHPPCRRPTGALPQSPADKGPSALLRPLVVGLGATLSPPESGTLFFKINHSAGELADNAGELKVEVHEERY